MNIGIIGVGKLGLSYALVFEESGFNVFASSYKQEYVELLQNKIVDTVEPGIKDRLQNSKNIIFTTDNYRVITQCEYIYVMVPTPSLPAGNYDISAVETVAKDFLNYEGDVRNRKLIIGCTMNPGDTKRIQNMLTPLGVKVVYSPTFVAQGNVIDRIYNPPGVLFGTEHIDIGKECQKIWSKIQKNNAPLSIVNQTTAEILKLTFNCLMTLRISFYNQIGELAIQSGVAEDLQEIDSAINRFNDMDLGFGFGFGGPCLPRDNRAMVAYARSIDSDYVFGDIVDKFNNNHSKFLADYLIGENVDENPYYFDYVTYKPGVTITDESQQFECCCKLLELGNTVYVNPSKYLPTEFKKILTEKYQNKVIFKSKDELIEESIDFYEVNM